MKRILLLGVCIILLSSCGRIDNRITSNGAVSGKDIVVTKSEIIIDVRTPEEYEEEHIKGAINIPYDTIDKNIDLPKESKIKVYCKSGNRSKKAYETLKKLGYDVEDLGAYNSIDLPRE